MFHNTTNKTNTALSEAKEAAGRQEVIVLDFFNRQHGSDYTPFEVHDKCFSDDTPVTSIRRAITNLTDDGKLIKTLSKRVGPYGRKCFTWVIASLKKETVEC